MIETRLLDESGIRFAAETEKSLFSDPWNQKAIADLFRSPYQKGLLLLWNSQPASYVFYSEIASEAEILRIGTAKEFQRRGFAEMLLNALFLKLKERDCEKVFLEVRGKNAPAIHLYEKMGFRLLSTRRNYYKDPADDALIYQTKLK